MCSVNLCLKSEHNILSYCCFKILAQVGLCLGLNDSIDPEFLVSLFYISVAIKGRVLKFNMFNRYKSDISKMVLVFSNFKIIDLK